MAYCQLSDVNNLVPQTPFGASSRPTATVVTAMIDDVSNEIDAWLSTIYVVPITTGSAALQFLTNLCAWGVLGRAMEARNTGVATEAAGVKSVWTKKYEEYLNNTIDPQVMFLLRDATRNADFIEKVPSQVVDSNAVSFPDMESDDDDVGDTRPGLGQTF